MSSSIHNEEMFVKRATELYGPSFQDHLRTKGFQAHEFLHSWAALTEIVSRRGVGPRVLDLGCGPGWTSIFLAGTGCHVTAMDASPDMVAKAKVKYPELDFSVANAASFHFDDSAVVHGGCRASGKHQADVFYSATLQSLSRPDMNGPFPSWIVAGAADCHSADAYQFEFPFFKRADFIRLIEALQNDFVHYSSPHNRS